MKSREAVKVCDILVICPRLRESNVTLTVIVLGEDLRFAHVSKETQSVPNKEKIALANAAKCRSAAEPMMLDYKQQRHRSDFQAVLRRAWDHEIAIAGN
jgi:hypothetical protein